VITSAQRDYIDEYAHVPEHVIHYVTAVSDAEPFLLQDFLLYFGKEHLIFVGYPLKGPFDGKKMKKTFDEALKRFKPADVALIAPELPQGFARAGARTSDDYYRLDLPLTSVPQKVRNMLERAKKDLFVEKVRSFSHEHEKLMHEFLKAHSIDKQTQFILGKIPTYLESAPTALIFEARDRDRDLVAFDVAELGPRHYAMYMFNIRSREQHVPGASDLLLSEVVQHAGAAGKAYINLGLGINPGVAFFKKKWGGVPFLSYNYVLYTPSTVQVPNTLFQRLGIP
jgi:hypothetical protein